MCFGLLADGEQHPLEGEGKKSKRQLKKEKKAAQALAGDEDTSNGTGVGKTIEEPPEEGEDEGPVVLVDPKAALKKLQSKASKGKASGAGAAAAAAKEAAARKAKLAKDKKKDKSKYNQAPTR